MAVTFRVQSLEERSDGTLAADTFVIVPQGEGTTEIHIGTVIISAAAILAVAGLPKIQRVAAYKATFGTDPRIKEWTDSAAASHTAAMQMKADGIVPPVTVTL